MTRIEELELEIQRVKELIGLYEKLNLLKTNWPVAYPDWTWKPYQGPYYEYPHTWSVGSGTGNIDMRPNTTVEGETK